MGAQPDHLSRSLPPGAPGLESLCLTSSHHALFFRCFPRSLRVLLAPHASVPWRTCHVGAKWKRGRSFKND